MKNFKLIVSVILIWPMCLTPALSADDDTFMNTLKPKKSFSYLGGSLSVFGENQSSSSGIGLGGDALYMRKIWGGFALGVDAFASFDIPTDRGGPTAAAGGSLLIGAVFEHRNGARSTYFLGPTAGPTIDDSHGIHAGLSLGGYYKFPRSQLTTGIILTAIPCSDCNNIPRARLSVGYTF